MSIVRAPRPDSGWYALDKRISEDTRMSWAARGLLVFLLGKPDHWRVSIEHLRQQTSGARVATGRDGVYALLGELEACGYVQRRQQRSADGRLGQVDYMVCEAPLPAEPHTAEPLPAEPRPAVATLVKTDSSNDGKKQQGQRARTRASVSQTTLPEWLDPQAWERFVAFRRTKAPLTADGVRLAIRELDKLRAQGNDPAAVIDQSILNGWRGLFALKENGNGNRNNGSAGRRESAAERAERVNRELDELEAARAPVHGFIGADRP